MPIVHMFCFICSQQWVKNISLCQNYGFISSLFKKIISNDTTPHILPMA